MKKALTILAMLSMVSCVTTRNECYYNHDLKERECVVVEEENEVGTFLTTFFIVFVLLGGE